MKELVLNVVTPERSIVSQLAVEAVVLPGSGGQLTLLPGHINFITSLKHGTFGYRVGEEWQIAFLSGGFTQVFEGKITVLAETIDMANELDLAKAELDLQEFQNQLKTQKVGSTEYQSTVESISMAKARVKAAQKKIH
jgi:F-type H+-transporting ATPase subunit epsilon